ncbi:hypothetical protein PR003_g23327 [Phytophthora rubi]|uniref:Uncharacterized protein n=1 Tax=Phytophthora rubi TaxID=129364 RepID=A0A6A3IR14_9STRA|nr:hypothetical protein PR001_g24371 [Phytophthora rubi]KAE8984337.1 hypothetical protein PR002_g22976 [Phytophthora rubi]KAE9298103.1 hypothetical protein PR003_g23327 [Phytophthora rubi]
MALPRCGLCRTILPSARALPWKIRGAGSVRYMHFALSRRGKHLLVAGVLDPGRCNVRNTVGCLGRAILSC